MARKRTRKKLVRKTTRVEEGLLRKRKYEVIFIIISIISTILLLSNFNLCGPVGYGLNTFFFGIIGWLNRIFPIYLFFATAFMLANRENARVMRKIFISAVVFISIAGILELIAYGDLRTMPWIDLYLKSAKSRNGGGLIGGAVAKLLNLGLAKIGAYVILFIILFASTIYLADKFIIDLIRGLNVKNEKDDEILSIIEERQRLHNERLLERRKQKEERKKLLEIQRLERERNRTSTLLKQSEDAQNIEDKKEENPVKTEKDTKTENSINYKKSLKSKKETKPEEEKTLEEVDVEIKEISPLERSKISFLADNLKNKENQEKEIEKQEEAEPKEETQFYLQELAKKFGGSVTKKNEEVLPDEGLEGNPEPLPKAEIVEPQPPNEEIKIASAFPKSPELSSNSEITENDEFLETSTPTKTEAFSQSTETTETSENIAKSEDFKRSELLEPSEVLKEYEFPPTELLDRATGNEEGMSDDKLLETALKLQKTLKAFGVNVEITDISSGPTVTRYELKPEQGVKVSKITALTDDIKLNLAAADIRIEAPIPGKAALGIEVPNEKNLVVYFRELIESQKFTDYSSKLAFAVGKDIAGQIMLSDIAKMPHLLIAGATGSGKSVCINTLIMSVLYKARPDEVKFIMIDPKVVELSVYNGIPHLLLPVVTDPKKAAAALNWAVVEMNRRYKLFAEMGVREIKGFNKKVAKSPEWMPQIVIIVDELADLMMVSSKEVEEAICRLAQLARAAGIHLVIATQRPSVNVITGLIKANIPSRIAFAVSSQVDSRTILDGAGAEKLLGKGDMLFFPTGYPKPVRIQGAFVSDGEVSKVVEYIKTNNGTAHASADITEEVNANLIVDSIKEGSDDSEELYDEYFYEAGKLIIEKDKASIGMLQRVYRIGFNRAARIMDQLYEVGVVGEEEGTKPRKVLMTKEDFINFMENKKGEVEEA